MSVGEYFSITVCNIEHIVYCVFALVYMILVSVYYASVPPLLASSVDRHMVTLMLNNHA